MSNFGRLRFILAVFGFVILIVDSVEANSELRSTLVTSHMEVPFQEGQNIVFCSTFQIAWNKLKEDILKEDIAVKTPVAMVPFLNRGISTEADLPQKNCLAVAGFVGNNILAQINRDLKRKFGFEARPLDPSPYHDPKTILSYSFLDKEMPFAHPFEDFEDPIAFCNKEGRENVAGFGIHAYLSMPNIPIWFCG